MSEMKSEREVEEMKARAAAAGWTDVHGGPEEGGAYWRGRHVDAVRDVEELPAEIVHGGPSEKVSEWVERVLLREKGMSKEERWAMMGVQKGFSRELLEVAEKEVRESGEWDGWIALIAEVMAKRNIGELVVKRDGDQFSYELTPYEES